MASTLTLQNVVDYSRTNTRLIPIVGVGGLGSEPALSICNDVLQETLSAPYDWRFNRINLPPFSTFQYVQDYPVTGATATVIATNNNNPNAGIAPIGPATTSSLFPTNGLTWAGGVATVTTTVPTTFQAGSQVIIANATVNGYNGTFPIASVISSTQFTYNVGGPLTPSGGPGIQDINWLERCVLQDFANTSNVKPVHDIEVVANLPIESIIQPPFKVSFQLEDADSGTVTFRSWPVPSSQIWTFFIDYQKKPPIKTSLAQTWTPLPDEMSYVIRQGFLAKALLHAEDPRAPVEYQRYQAYLLKFLDIKDQEQRHESFFPDRPMLFGG